MTEYTTLKTASLDCWILAFMAYGYMIGKSDLGHLFFLCINIMFVSMWLIVKLMSDKQ